MEIPTVTGWIEEAALAMEASEGAAAALAAETAPPAGAAAGGAAAEGGQSSEAGAVEVASGRASGPTGGDDGAENNLLANVSSGSSGFPAVPPAVPAQQLVPNPVSTLMVESVKTQAREVAEAMKASLGKEWDTTLILLTQEEIQRRTLSVPHAPEIFRLKYDTSTNFSWAAAGFNPIQASFFPNSVKTLESAFNICAGYLFFV